MKKLKLKKLILGLLLASSALALNPIGASAEWRKNNTGWWYAQGNSWATGWREIDGKWYFFDSNGYMVTNMEIDGCNLGSDGAWDGTTKKTLLTKDDFNNFSLSDSSKGNFIDWTKSKGYTWSYSVIFPDDTNDKKFRTSKNIGLGDSLDDIGRAYNTNNLRTFAIRSDEVCSSYPKWSSLSVTSGFDMLYYDNGDTYEIRYYLNSSNKIVMIAYFKNMKYITKNDMKWS